MLIATFFNFKGFLSQPEELPLFTAQILSLLLIVSTLYFSALRTDQRKIEFRLEELVDRRTRDLMNANQELRDEVFNRQQAEKSLQRSSWRYKALFETAGIPIIVLDAKFNIKQWNTAAEIHLPAEDSARRCTDCAARSSRESRPPTPATRRAR